ncbi:MAG TPA: hypothetical protein VN704_09520 [Verrucomicrobiae bacterium]|jgi:hypothetical protein|nr:hypothetical protein [Verrucomicrobiae bacterium]
MSLLEECKDLLKQIGELESQLNNASGDRRKKLNQEVQSKKSRYNQLGCGSIDPPGGSNENNP